MAKGIGIKRTLKQPGSYRTLVGGTLVFLLALATAVGQVWTDWEHEEMDLDNQLVPPEVAWLKRLLTTEEGLRIHERNKAGAHGNHPGRPKEGEGGPEDGDDLDFLTPSAPGEGGSLGPSGTGNGSASGGIASPVARLQEEDEELDALEKPAPASPVANPPKGSGTQAADSAESALGAAVSGEGGTPQVDVPQAGGSARAEAGIEASETKRPHYLGTDKNGRDMLALLVAGARTCFIPGLVTCSVALGVGIPFGLLAGFYGGRFRSLVHTLNGTVLSMPRLVLILVVICALEPNVYYTMAVLGVTLIPRVSELISTRVRILSNMGFILAAKEAALSDFKILYRHLFWYQNRAVFFIQFSLIMAESILVETTLSYLQFGTKPPEVSWGNIIEGSQMSFFSGFYWITFFPAVAIILAILGFFYLGDGLNARLAYREGR